MNFSKSRGLDLQSQANLGTTPSGGIGTALSSPGFADFYSSLEKKSPRYDRLAATSIANRSAERAAVTAAEADVHAMGLSSVSAVRSAEVQAEAAKAAARAEANGQMWGSAFSAIGSIGGALLLSDASTKENVTEIEDGLSVIKKLKPKTYNYKPEWQGFSNRKHSGFIAQEYQKVIPEGTYNDEESGKLVVDLAEVIAPLVSAVQQLEARINELESK